MSAKLPRDLGGRDLAVLLNRHFGYAIGRQSGSHMRMTTSRGGEHHLTIPDAKPLRVGTLAGILGDVAAHFDISRSEVERQLFETWPSTPAAEVGSDREQLVAHEVETNHPRSFALVEVNGDRISNHIPQALDVIGFGEDRLPESTGREAPFRGLLDEKDELGTTHDDP